MSVQGCMINTLPNHHHTHAHTAYIAPSQCASLRCKTMMFELQDPDPVDRLWRAQASHFSVCLVHNKMLLLTYWSVMYSMILFFMDSFSIFCIFLLNDAHHDERQIRPQEGKKSHPYKCTHKRILPAYSIVHHNTENLCFLILGHTRFPISPSLFHTRAD